MICNLMLYFEFEFLHIKILSLNNNSKQYISLIFQNSHSIASKNLNYVQKSDWNLVDFTTELEKMLKPSNPLQDINSKCKKETVCYFKKQRRIVKILITKIVKLVSTEHLANDFQLLDHFISFPVIRRDEASDTWACWKPSSSQSQKWGPTRHWGWSTACSGDPGGFEPSDRPTLSCTPLIWSPSPDT